MTAPRDDDRLRYRPNGLMLVVTAIGMLVIIAMFPDDPADAPVPLVPAIVLAVLVGLAIGLLLVHRAGPRGQPPRSPSRAWGGLAIGIGLMIVSAPPWLQVLSLAGAVAAVSVAGWLDPANWKPADDPPGP